jgi:hypothetical protein
MVYTFLAKDHRAAVTSERALTFAGMSSIEGGKL